MHVHTLKLRRYVPVKIVLPLFSLQMILNVTSITDKKPSQE